MKSSYQQLANSIKIKFGTGPDEPNEYQIEKIIQDIENIKKTGSRPSDSDWYSIVKKYCPSAGSYKYSGLDNSDLNTLLSLATNTIK